MIKGRLVTLRLLTSDLADIDFIYRASCEDMVLHNLSDRGLFTSRSQLEKLYHESDHDTKSDDLILLISYHQVPIGIIYMFINKERRNAEIQVEVTEAKYRDIGLGFDALHAATKFAREELNLHGVMFKIASHNETMVKGFKASYSRWKKASEGGAKPVGEESMLFEPDLVERSAFISKGKREDYLWFTFVLDDEDFPFEDFLTISRGNFEKYRNEEGLICLRSISSHS
ncbi:hypothetical protein SY88_22600 [Clostridiales bacterium PH28_bin88]|nr:hypothetical protein SY88_22600 [Clostridiales bacterium PH28_bin88]